MAVECHLPVDRDNLRGLTTPTLDLPPLTTSIDAALNHQITDASPKGVEKTKTYCGDEA